MPTTHPQTRKIQSGPLHRELTLDRSGINEEARTVALTFSSEEPYQRWFGNEILDHSSSSVRMDRLRNAAPLLVDHNPGDQVGVTQEASIGSDRRGRAVVRFGKSARADEIFQDVQDGIRTKVSVGYRIHEMVLDRQDGDVPTYRVTDWEPLEVSIVAVPADDTVGVGRSDARETFDILIRGESNMNEDEKKAAEAAEAARKANLEAQRKAEIERIDGIRSMAAAFPLFDVSELVRNAISAGDSVAVFAKALGDAIKSKPVPTVVPPSTDSVVRKTPFGAGARGFLPHARLRAFTHERYYNDQGELMTPEEAAYRTGMWGAAVIYRHAPAQKWCQERGIDTSTRVMTGMVGSSGGFLVPTEAEQAIIDLRDNYGVARRLARVRPMASDSKIVPRRKGGLTAYFTGEDTSGVTASDKQWDNVGLNAKTLAALALFSIQLEEDAVIDLGDDLAFEMAWAFAQKEDQCWLIGDGTSAYGGMEGLNTKFEATAYKSRITIPGSGHDTFPEVDSTDVATVMGGPAAYGKPGAAWLCSETFAATVFDRLSIAGGGNTNVTIAGVQRRAFNGYEIVTSEVMPSDPAADLTNKVMCLFGRFDMSSSFGSRRGIMMQVLRERYAEKLQVGVLGTERFDIVNHDLGDTSNKGPVAAMYGAT